MSLKLYYLIITDYGFLLFKYLTVHAVIEFVSDYMSLLLQFTGIEAISGVSLAAFTTLAWMKFIIAEKLHSDALRTDGIKRNMSNTLLH